MAYWVIAWQIELMFVFAIARLAWHRLRITLGAASVASRPRITMTTMSSASEKPAWVERGARERWSSCMCERGRGLRPEAGMGEPASARARVIGFDRP